MRPSDLTLHYGVILATERFEDCVRFYRDRLGLPVWFEKDGLCCLRFGAGYLMIETGGAGCDRRKTATENPTVLRFNVADIEATARLLGEQGIAVKVQHFDWGTIGAFRDPDGNACELAHAGDREFSNAP